MDKVELAVWYGEMPESNGRRNWTASLHRKGGSIHQEGFCFARSEYPGRVMYEADRMRWIIGELPERPDILAYDADLHSGYVDPPALRTEPSTASLQARIALLEGALEFYARENNYKSCAIYMCGHSGAHSISLDGGNKARAALQEPAR